MNIRDLEYIIAIAKYKSFIKASQNCFVSQPALSMQVKKLEEELGVDLFERQHKQILLTEAGKAIIKKAELILNEVKNLKALAVEFQNPLAGILKFGLFPTIAQYILPSLLEVIQKQLPEIKLHPVEEKTEVIEKKLIENDLDCALLAWPVDESLFTFIPIFKDPLLAAVPKNHPLSNKKEINLNDLAKEPFLLLEAGHCLSTQTLSICAKNEHPLNIDRTATSLESLRHMVIASLGVTIMPQIAISHCPYQSNAIVYLPFKGETPFRQIGLVFRKTYTNKQLQQRLAEALKRHFN